MSWKCGPLQVLSCSLFIPLHQCVSPPGQTKILYPIFRSLGLCRASANISKTILEPAFTVMGPIAYIEAALRPVTMSGPP